MTNIVNQDGFERRRFQRDSGDILKPEQFEAIMDDEHHVATVLANDPDETRAGKLVLLSRDFLTRAREGSAWEAKLTKILLIAGAVYTIYQVRKHFRNKEHIVPLDEGED